MKLLSKMMMYCTAESVLSYKSVQLLHAHGQVLRAVCPEMVRRILSSDLSEKSALQDILSRGFQTP